MAVKIKDSMLRLYAKGKIFDKEVLYLLFINFDILKARERVQLYERIQKHIPTGLESEDFKAFKKIAFAIVNKEELFDSYGIACSLVGRN
jgi:hypothetical protein